MSNNRQVQEFASKSGAINLVSKFMQEETVQIKDAIFGSLASWIKADNFEGKRRFINDQQGLCFLASLICDSSFNQAFTMRLKKKVISLINDLVINDDGIYAENPFFVREHFCGDQDFLLQLKSSIVNADLSNMQELQYRDTLLNIIFRLHQYKPDVLGPHMIPVLYQHRANIMALMADPQVDQDLKDMLNEEIQRVDDAIAAPSRPFVRNFEAETEQE